MGRCQALELGARALPGQRSGGKTFVVALLNTILLPIFEYYAQTTGHLGGKTRTQSIVWPHNYLLQQRLYIVTPDTLRSILGGRKLTIQQGNRQHIGQAVIGLLFCADPPLIAFLATTDDV